MKLSRKDAKAQRKTQSDFKILLRAFLCAFAPLREKSSQPLNAMEAFKDVAGSEAQDNRTSVRTGRR